MNDARALLAMKFNNIENVDDENEWAEVLTSQVPSTYKQYAMDQSSIFLSLEPIYFQFLYRAFELEEIKSALLQSLVSNK